MNLIFQCSTLKDFDNFNRIVSKSEFSAESINHEFRSFYFNCSSQEDADNLEIELQYLIDMNGKVSGYFESEGD